VDKESDFASREERDDKLLLPPPLAQPNKRKRPLVEDEEGEEDEEGGDKEGANEEAEDEEGEGEVEEAAKGSCRDASVLITTITNCNRRALRQQDTRRLAKVQRRRTSIGLIELAKDAPVAEHAAYTLIKAREEQTVS
jgi:hypothetical protein